MGTKRNVYGEGNYEATRQYNQATKTFIASGKVEQAARDAAPRNTQEAAEMKQAEQAALLRAKEAPAVKQPSLRGQRNARRIVALIDNRRREGTMLRYAAIFFVIALAAALFGFTGIAAGAAEIAKILFFVFIVLFVVSLVAGLIRRGPTP